MANRATALNTRTLKSLSRDPYSTFDKLDGQHPWQSQVPEGFISYPVRRLGKGKVGYFNFSLAKEMGLLPKEHPDKLTPELKKKIIDSFSLRIINEYDQQNNKRYSPQMIKKNKFMACRYLQLQHENKQGKTSGDGRGIWNGSLSHNGKTWDVSSRGTGVTALAPGVVKAGFPLESGNTDHGYGCGLAEIDELYSGLIMSEIFHSYGVNTERTLAVIDFDNGFGIGVRAATNLLRPAHLFLYLKQENLCALRRATDFLIDRQYKNNEWRFSSKHPQKYDLLLDVICEKFSYFAAQMEREYIFTWLAWDGDNVLATAGIIDYGSVRLFGLRHDQYRYDDEDRYSTNLNEQRANARLTVQIFIQMVDYLKSSKKKPLNHYNNHPLLRKFDKNFSYQIHSYFLKQLGLKPTWIKNLMGQNPSLVKRMYENYVYLERMKVSKKLSKTDDGVNRPPKFNLKNLIRELPQQILDPVGYLPTTQSLFETIISEHSRTVADKKLQPSIKRRLEGFRSDYIKLLNHISTKKSNRNIIKTMVLNSEIYNRPDRITGNALIFIVEMLLKAKKRGLKYVELQSLISDFISQQSLALPSSHNPPFRKNKNRLMKRALSIVDTHSEDI